LKLFILILLLILTFFRSAGVLAESKTDCDNRYLTLVNPVRSRNLWTDKSLKPIEDQYRIINNYNFPATWLIQDDVLNDGELLKYIKEFDQDQEIGVFLEISQSLADRSKVIYAYDQPWFSPNVVFLSAYSRSDREKLIDKIFSRFKNEFGFYPKSVGAWWIDSYSLNYLKDKYKITSAMIVADQKTTDKYGVWGQWWGVPYYPSKANILVPASNKSNKMDVAIIQWAQRDVTGTVGEGHESSNYSLQANDYIRQGKNTKYFEEIVGIYLDCKNGLGQITVGLETGQESVGYIDEYANQLNYLKSISYLQALTMNQFSQEFKKFYPDFPRKGSISREDSEWIFDTNSRVNQKYSDVVKYKSEIAFKDYFLADKSGFLDRVLPVKESKNLKNSNNFLNFFFILGLGVLAIFRKRKILFLSSLLFLISCFGLILRSNIVFGWQVFYGPKLNNLFVVQFVLTLTIFGLFYLVWEYVKSKKNKEVFLWMVSLSFGFDFILQELRYIFLAGQYYFGIGTNSLSILGITWNKNFQVSLLAKEFPSFQAASFLRLDINKYLDNLYFTFLVYPLIHIILGLFLTLLFLKLPRILRNNLIALLSILLIFHLLFIFNADPRVVLP